MGLLGRDNIERGDSKYQWAYIFQFTKVYTKCYISHGCTVGTSNLLKIEYINLHLKNLDQQ